MLFLATLVACKSTAPAVNKKLDNKTERMLKGNWTITSVSYPGDDFFKVNSFNLAHSKCFIGSNWSFISNNNKGSMSINNPNTTCKEFSSPITWYINKEGNFVLKIINDHKAKEVNYGFVLNVNDVSENSFNLVDKINVSGAIKNIKYTFQRK